VNGAIDAKLGLDHFGVAGHAQYRNAVQLLVGGCAGYDEERHTQQHKAGTTISRGKV
jgi:hypothetical protein